MLCVLDSCQAIHTMQFPVKDTQKHLPSGSEFYREAATWQWRKRDSAAQSQILSGNLPAFLSKFCKIETTLSDPNGKLVKAFYYVSPDYLSIGSDADWARIPLTPMAAQAIADSFQCFLPTRKMVNDIYRQANVKLEPVPMFAFRDSTVTFWQHHLMIEGQRKGRKGLIAGIKKDLVISAKLKRETSANKEAIYGWHKTDGIPIQPLYTGHVNWYVDYSHGVRLVYRKIFVNGKSMDYQEVLQDPFLKKLLCDEEDCGFYRYE